MKAADRLGINRNTLHKKWEQYKIDTTGHTAPPVSEDLPSNEAAAG